VICTHVFEPTARFQAEALGLPELGIIVVPHPFSGIDPAEVQRKAEAAFEGVLGALTERGRVPVRAVHP